MSKVTLLTFGSDLQSKQNLNANNTTITTAFDNTLSRDGTGPNQMQAVLDMNSNRIINLGVPINGSDAVSLNDIQAAVNTAVSTVSASSVFTDLWSKPALSITNTPPGSPSIGDRYLIGTSPTGVWVGHGNSVTEYKGSTLSWVYDAPKVNQLLDVANSSYRYSQEAFDGSVAWRPAFNVSGYPRGLYDPSDEPGSFGGQRTNTREACGALYSETGNAMPIHYNTLRGSFASPQMPLSGANIIGIGGRTWDSVANTYQVSHAAFQAYLVEDAIASNYIGSRCTVETSPKHGTSPFARRVVMQWDDTGAAFSVGTGNTTPSMDTSGSKRWFYGPESSVGMAVQSDGAVAIYANRVSSDGAIMEFRRQNATVGTISVTGAATAYNTSSDSRLKTRVGPVDSGRIIDSVSPHEFTWNVDGTKDVGFFAQELQEAVKQDIPHAVHEGKGELGDEDFDPWGVDYSKLVPVLWAEVQSLRARVDALEAK